MNCRCHCEVGIEPYPVFVIGDCCLCNACSFYDHTFICKRKSVPTISGNVSANLCCSLEDAEYLPVRFLLELVRRGDDAGLQQLTVPVFSVTTWRLGRAHKGQEYWRRLNSDPVGNVVIADSMIRDDLRKQGTLHWVLQEDTDEVFELAQDVDVGCLRRENICVTNASELKNGRAPPEAAIAQGLV